MVRCGRVLFSTMSESWSNDETFKFIELYQKEPVIWNPKNKYHKDKNRVNDAWKRIAEAMSIPVQELIKKKETLMAAFRMNHKKVLASIKSGAGEEEIFKPIWIYYDVLAAFMSDIYECKSVLTTENEESSTCSEPSADDHVTANSVERPVQIPVQKRRCQRPVELAETQAQMNTALTVLNKALNNPKENEHEDECDLYGRLLAHKLKSYSSIERQELMYEIDGLLLKKRKRVIVSGPPTQIILSRPTSSRTMYSSFPRSSSTNSNYCSNSPHAASIDSVNSPPEMSFTESPSAIYVSQPQSPQTMFETNYETQSQDILSQACHVSLFENNN